MEKNHSINEASQINLLLAKILKSKGKWLLWQNHQAERVTNGAYLAAINIERNEILFQTPIDHFNQFKKDLVVFFYQNDEYILFKMIIVRVEGNKLYTNIPDQVHYTHDVQKSFEETLGNIKLSGMTEFFNDEIIKISAEKKEKTSFEISLSEYQLDASDFSIDKQIPESEINEHDNDVELENADAYKHLRTSKRLRPKVVLKIKIQRVLADEIQDPEEFSLADLSQGGAGFYVDNKNEFTKGDKILVIASGGKKIDPPLQGEVVAIRLENPEDTNYKIGIRFG